MWARCTPSPSHEKVPSLPTSYLFSVELVNENILMLFVLERSPDPNVLNEEPRFTEAEIDRLRAKREQLDSLPVFVHLNQYQNLGLTVVYVPYSLDSGSRPFRGTSLIRNTHHPRVSIGP